METCGDMSVVVVYCSSATPAKVLQCTSISDAIQALTVINSDKEKEAGQPKAEPTMKMVRVVITEKRILDIDSGLYVGNIRKAALVIQQ